MLDFAPSHFLLPWDYLFKNLQEAVPPGSFYSQALDLLPRTIKPTEFVLFTDHFVPTTISVNGRKVGTIIPNSELTRVKIQLLEPPATNFITISNSIDNPVYVEIASTHMATHLSSFAQELYKFAGRLSEKYFYAMNSPWATFFVEYQLPWLKILPDLTEIRLLSVNAIANTLFGETGQQGGITDLISAFTVNTPAHIESRNPDLFQPDLFQPVVSGEDMAGFESHVWLGNTCLNRWLAFNVLLNNADAFNVKSANEDAVLLQYDGTEFFEQHIFDTTGPACSILGLVDFLGCMDNITAACELDLNSWPTICIFANPFDMQVELPGIGGKFWDSGSTLDGAWGPFDDLYDIDTLTDFWIGTNTSNHFDFGGCLDTYSQPTQAPQNTDCCSYGPDTQTFHTAVIEMEVTSTTTPNHPIFGGGVPGLLSNPTFSHIYGA